MTTPLKMNPQLRAYLIRHVEGAGFSHNEAARLVDDHSVAPCREVSEAIHAWWDEMMPQMQVTSEIFSWDETSGSWVLVSSRSTCPDSDGA